MKKRSFSFLLALCMVASALPFAAFAEDAPAWFCGKEEHFHLDSCYSTILICEAAEHRHAEDCYTDSQELSCDVPEHAHDIVQCYTSETIQLVCGLDVHSHETACQVNPNALAESAACTCEISCAGSGCAVCAAAENCAANAAANVSAEALAAVAEVNGTPYETLLDAVSAAGEGDTIRLIDDIEITAETTFAMPVGSTLDMNGKTVKAKDGKALFVGTSFTIHNGIFAAMAGKDYYLLTVDSASAKALRAASDITLENLTFVNGGLKIRGGATVTLKDNHIQANQSQYKYAVWAYGSANVAIESGTYFGGKNGYDVFAEGNARITVYGGIYKFRIVEKYLAKDADLELTANDNGGYTVADASGVAAVNGKKYQTLQAAIDAAGSGDTVTLLCDIEYHEKIANGFDVTVSKSLTLNLGEYWIRDTLTGSSFVENGVPYTIGVLKIKPVDSSIHVTINATTGGISTASTRYAIHCGNGTAYNANLTINGGNYIGGDICIKQDKGTLTITDGSFQVTSKSYPNQYVLDTTDKYASLAKFNITGGRFKGFNPACCFINKGKRHDHSHVSDGYTGVLGQDGWYTVQEGRRAAKTGFWCYSTLMDAINNINISKEGNEILIIAAYEVTAEEAAAVIEKGLKVYRDGAEPTLPAGYVWDENNQLVASPVISAAEVNGTPYATLQAAIDAANPGDTVTVLCDIRFEEANDYLFINKSLTLNLGSHTITYTADGAEGGFDLGKGDVDYKGKPLNYASAALIIRAETQSIQVVIDATTGGITATGAYACAINAGNIGDGNDACKTSLTINGGSYTAAGNCAVYQNNGVCTINGGSYRADGRSDIANGQPVYNTLVLNNKDYYEGSFAINGGKFYGFNPACLSINKHDHHDHDTIAAGMTGVLDDEGWFTVQEGTLVAKTVCAARYPASAHGHCYASLEDAMKALENCCQNDKIELTADVAAYAALHIGSGANKDKVIVIDAGHQEQGNPELEPNGPGSDTMKAKVASGTYGRFTGIQEYVLNLEVAIALRDELLRRGYTVVMVRQAHDVDISNVQRAQIANVYDADALIRIHANGDNNASKTGAMGLCQTQNNPYPDCKAVYTESLLLTNSILSAYCKETGMKQGSVWKTDTMTGINWVSVPATILEMGYMTNKSDDTYMATAGFKPLAAEGIANGLDAYFAALQN